jgi:hypothetical protein
MFQGSVPNSHCFPLLKPNAMSEKKNLPYSVTSQVRVRDDVVMVAWSGYCANQGGGNT